MTARLISAGSCIVHETPQRLRLELPPSLQLVELRAQLERLPGVSIVRVSPSIRSVTVRYDGRARTRAALLRLVEQSLLRPGPSSVTRERPARTGNARGWRPWVPALATVAIPLAPASVRPAVALGALAARTAARSRRERQTTAFVLDSLSLATTALTGHPATTAASILLGGIAEAWRDELLEDVERLLEHLTPPPDPEYVVNRDGVTQQLTADALRTGDTVLLAASQVVPTDGVVRSGVAWILPRTRQDDPQGRPVQRGKRIASGERLSSGSVRYVVERPAAHSQARRMREHVRHTLRTRDAPGGLTPDLERLAALPVTTAGLVLAMTGDAGRSAAMLQADPQHGLLLSHPVAREAALYAMACNGLLGSGLDTVERLALGTALAVEDIRILTERSWHVSEVRSAGGWLDHAKAQRWLARLAGIEPVEAEDAGFRDRKVSDWLEHGAVLHEASQIIHVAGAELLCRTWGLEIAHPDRGSLERVLGIVVDGRQLGSIKLRVRLRPRVGEQLQRLRALGFRRIAILTEDLEERAGHELEALGADAIVSTSRAEQGRWLNRAVEDGERVVLLHTGLRDLLPPGGLSVCPVEADAGAHAVLIGEPLQSLVAARSIAATIHRKLRRHFGSTTAVNAALMLASGLRLIPPIVNTTLHHAATLALLRSSVRLAEATNPEEP